jgi:hypothetical protein
MLLHFSDIDPIHFAKSLRSMAFISRYRLKLSQIQPSYGILWYFALFNQMKIQILKGTSQN